MRDYDLMLSPILTRFRIAGVPTEVVITGGKMGAVYAYRARDGRPLWTLPVGRHQNDTGPLPRDPVEVYPGTLGGVETPMALAGERLFVPWVDLGTRASAHDVEWHRPAAGRPRRPPAVDATSGRVLWQRRLPSLDLGAATVANDVVFTSTYDGHDRTPSTRPTGTPLWSARARAGINSFPAIAGDMLLVGAAAPGFFAHPRFELIAYAL